MSEYGMAIGAPDVIRHSPIRRDPAGNPLIGPDGKPVRDPEREFKLAPIDRLDVVGRWEEYLEDCAWDALKRQRKRMHPEEYSAKETALLAAIAGGTYSVFGEVSYNAMMTPWRPGYRKLIHLRLLPYHPDATEALAREIADEDCESLRRKMLTVYADPNAPAAVAGDDATAAGSAPSASPPPASKPASPPATGPG